ncbi:PHD finger protein ALFIN-LIKE 9-like [Punica granatum]|uniref:PHD finger protein ALFIN-LIKE n=1 Tax=Punica granatum TaxID=22663 RepID=A0A218VT15_PUNGR|nr:PHD finger protein ALFIN-LIKE 9-like [Punica granatum]OWM63348.1 hypothetical protein CDL15_Pgr022093 [Punica granatum]
MAGRRTENCEPSKVVKVFNDLKGRRAALIKALTTDVADFYKQCDPDKEDQALYGFPDGHWEVKVPEEELPPKLPEPTIAINVSKDDMLSQEWLCHVAANSDAWLLSVMSYCSASLKFSKDDRRQLFNMINDLPTVLEVVSSGTVEKPTEVRSAVLNNSSSHPGPNVGTHRDPEPQSKGHQAAVHPKSENESALEEQKDRHGRDKGVTCGGNGTASQNCRVRAIWQLFIQSLRISRLCKKNTKVNMGQ